MRSLVALAFSVAMASGAHIEEFIAEKMPTASCHASTVVELANGDLLAAWFGGTREGARDVAVWMARRTAEGWSAPNVAAREPDVAAYNPVLFHSGDGVLWLWYKFGESPETWSAARMFSRDEGASWSAVEHLPAGLYGPIRAKPLVLKNGTILAGSSVESYGTWACWIERSTDNGRTWTRIGPIAGPRSPTPARAGESHGIIQPSLVDFGGRHIRLYARSTNDIGRICRADSFDDGLSWSAAERTELPNPNSGIDVVRLRDGRLVMVYNNSTTARTPLTLAVSADGERWTNFRELETGPGEYSYPAIVQARNGDLLITYTWRRQRIRFVRLPVENVPGGP